MWYLMIFLVREGRWVWKVKSIEIKIESIFPVIGVSFLFSFFFIIIISVSLTPRLFWVAQMEQSLQSQNNTVITTDDWQ